MWTKACKEQIQRSEMIAVFFVSKKIKSQA
jgi:hypothetical protein